VRLYDVKLALDTRRRKWEAGIFVIFSFFSFCVCFGSLQEFIHFSFSSLRAVILVFVVAVVFAVIVSARIPMAMKAVHSSL